MSVYWPCDIRGQATSELTPDLYRRWGAVLGRQAPRGGKFVVGGDTRGSTPEFLAALAEGLLTSELDVVNVGFLPTPMIYHAMGRIRADGCAIVTASHSDPAVNGLKWMIGDRPPTMEEVAALAKAVETVNGHAYNGERAARELDVTFDYVANLQEVFVDAMHAQLHIVIDPLFGAWSMRARRYLQAIFPQCLFSAIHDRPDAAFGGLLPDCALHENLHDLAEAVYHAQADLGIAFDGDGDRLALVDDAGMILSPDEAAWIMLQCTGQSLRGERVVCDARLSDRIVEAVRELGGEPVRQRSGHAFFRAQMQNDNALFGAELNGHYFFRALGRIDDGLYAACRLIASLAETQSRLSDLRADSPTVYATPELRLEVACDKHLGLLTHLREQWADFPQSTIDGVRVDTPAGWFLLRSSITEPAMKVRFESIDFASLDDLVQRFSRSLPEVGQQILDVYHAATGVPEAGL